MCRSTELPDREGIQAFEATRPALLGLAYRLLGSLADAEDAVQDTYLKWAKAERREIENPAAWLTTVCTRRCLDLLRAARRTRVSYVGAWLPEPIHTPVESDAESRLELASSLTMAFLLLLDRLTPRERAAYLLHDIFDYTYPEIAATLELEESACRKLVSRARGAIERAKIRHKTPLEQQNRLLAAFQTAVVSGEAAPLAALLSDDIRLSADGGGKVPAVLRVLDGRTEVGAFLAERLHDYWAGQAWIAADINGARGFLLQRGDTTTAAVSFAYDEAGRATDIFIVRNPDKLVHLDPIAIH